MWASMTFLAYMWATMTFWPVAGIPGPLNAAGTGQEDNFYPYEETPVTEKYLPAPGREKFVNDGMLMLQDVQCT